MDSGGSSCKPLQPKLELRNDCERFDCEDDCTAQVVKMSVTVSNSPIQGYFHLDDHTHSKKLLFFKIVGNQSTVKTRK